MKGERIRKIVRSRRVRKTGSIIIALFLLYVIAGFWIAPPILKSRLAKGLTDALGRPVTIGAVKLNPLVLSATITDLIVHELDGAPFAGFSELYVNVQLSSLFRWAGTVREIRLTAPFGVLQLMSGGKLNIDDLIARFVGPRPQPETERGLPRAIISRLAVIDGKFTFSDLAAAEPVQDVIAPITFTLENLSTLKGREGEFHFTGEGPIGGTFRLGGNLELNPPRIRGRFSTSGIQLVRHWEHIKDQVSFEIASGSVGVSGDFYAAIDDGGLSAGLENAAVRLVDFRLSEKGRETVLVALPMVAVTGIRADLKAREITIESIESADSRIHSWLSADGTFAIQELLLRDFKKLMEKTATHAPAPDAQPREPWQAMLKKMALTNGQLAFEDRTLSDPAQLSVDDIRVVVSNVSTAKNAQATVTAAMTANRAGQIRVDGTAGINPLQAQMTVVTEKIALQPFQPYVADAVNAVVSGGSTSSTGRIRYQGSDAHPQITYEGEFSVDDLVIQDRVQPDDFVTLAQVKASGIALALLPNRLGVADIHIDRPHARITIDEAGIINVVKALSPTEKEKEPGQEDLLQRLVKVLIMEFKGPMPIHLPRVRLDRLSADFADASVSPPFNTHVEITEGTVRGLSSEASARADFGFKGSIDRAAAFTGSGRINPMNARQYSKADVSLKDFALPSVSPYSGKYIGLAIDAGTLETTLQYTVKDDRVEGDNVITIDRLMLGEKVASPDALNLPVKLGVALLKDRNGRIQLQVPVVGNVKDPRFDVAKTIRSALTGVIEKAGSDPFATIGEIDGFTGDDLREVEFDFGLSSLQAPQTRKLDALAGYLKQKGTLTLGIVGMADRHMDGAAVMGLSPRQSPADTASASKAKTPIETAQAVAVDNARLESLALRRAEKVSAYLTGPAGIDAARIEIKPVQIIPEPEGATATAEFTLTVK